MLKEGLAVDQCVATILKAVTKQKEEIVFGKKEVYGVYIKRFLPKLFTPIMKRQKPND